MFTEKWIYEKIIPLSKSERWEYNSVRPRQKNHIINLTKLQKHLKTGVCVVKLNLIPFYAEALSIKPYLYNDIDKIHATNKEAFYLKAQESPFYNHTIAREGSLIRDYYFKKLIGIFEYYLATEDTAIGSAISNLFKKGYKKAYAYYKTKNTYETIDFGEFNKEVMKPAAKNSSDDELNGLLSAGIFFSHNYNVVNMESFLDIYTKRWQNYEGHRRITDTTLERYKEEIKSLNREIPRDIVSNITAAVAPDQITPYEFLYDSERLSQISLFDELVFSKKDIDLILVSYVICQKHYDYNIPVQDYILPALHIKGLLKAYNVVKELYFKNNKETMYVEMGIVQRELQKTKTILATERAEASALKQKEKHDLLSLQKENESLNKKIRNLEMKISGMKSDTKEVTALRELAFKMSQESEIANNIPIDIELLNNISGTIIGGHPNWRNKIKEQLRNWNLFGPDSFVDDKTILNSTIVVINTSYLNHTTYNRIIDLIRKENIPLGYVTNTNLELTLQEIYDIANSNNLFK